MSARHEGQSEPDPVDDEARFEDVPGIDVVDGELVPRPPCVSPRIGG